MGVEELPATGEVGASQGLTAAPEPSVFGASAAKLEPLYQATLAKLQKPSALNSGFLLIASLAAFLLIGGLQQRSVSALVALVLTLAIHEMGHFTGMKLFGYRDVKMFFIPFFGAAVSGKPAAGIAPWKQAIVLLLGPVPGIVLGFILALHWGSQTSPYQHALIFDLVVINGFNLLPLAVVDGGKLLQNVLFARGGWVEIGFQVLMTLALGLVALGLKSILLGFLAYIVLLSIPYQWRLLKKAAVLRAQEADLPTDVKTLDGDVGRRVFLAAREVFPRGADRPARLVEPMRQLLDVANRQAPSASGAWLPVLGWLGALALALVATAAVIRPPLRWVDWKAEDGTFSVSLPGAPQHDPQDLLAHGGNTLVMAKAGKVLVSIVRSPAPPPSPSADAGPSVLFHGEPATDRTVSVPAPPGAAFKHDVSTRVVSVVHGDFKYTLVATGGAAKASHETDRFFDSFEFTDPK